MSQAISVFDYKGYLQIMNVDGAAHKVLLADNGYDPYFILDYMKKRVGIAMIANQAEPAHTCRSKVRFKPCAIWSNYASTNSRTLTGWQLNTTKLSAAISASSK